MRNGARGIDCRRWCLRVAGQRTDGGVIELLADSLDNQSESACATADKVIVGFDGVV